MSILRRNMAKREEFDPSNALHIKSLESFILTGAWGSVQFYAELPHVEVPMTVLMKFVQHTLRVKPEQASARAARMSNLPSFSRVTTDKATPTTVDFSNFLTPA